jgi:predicted outer membrane repeat protein
MTTKSWRLWVKSAPCRRREGKAPRPPIRPRLEPLEGRALPSTFVVANLNDSGAGSLRQAVLDANASPGADVIRFAHTLRGTIPLGSPLTITDDLTIEGPGAQRLTVSNADPTALSVIVTAGPGVNLTLDGLTFTGGTVSGAGGSSLTVRDSVFTHSAGNTPLSASGSLVVEDTRFTDNQGGAIFAFGDVTVNDSAFDNNQGRAIVGFGDITVTDSAFDNNQGGAIFGFGDITVTDSAFDNNQTGAGGGAIEAFQSLTVTDCVFANNQAGFGGAIDTEGADATLTVTDCRFDHNSAGNNGGAISSGSPGTFTDDVFTDNRDVGPFAEGGALTCFSGQTTIIGCTFRGNLARATDFGSPAGGGAVLDQPSTDGLIVTDSLFADNRAVGADSTSGPGGDAQGGAIAEFSFSDPSLQASGSTFVGNAAVGGAGGPGAPGGGAFGGAIYKVLPGSATLADCVLADNTAVGGAGGDGANGGDAYGGALLIDARRARRPFTTTMTLDDTVVRFNQARGGAGANGGNAFGGGIAEGRTTAVANVVLVLNVNNDSRVNHNAAYGGDARAGGIGGNAFGGGIFVGAGATSATINDSEVAHNAARGGGGGPGGADGQGIGGGIYITAGADVAISLTSVIKHNRASTSDGDIFGAFTPF